MFKPELFLISTGIVRGKRKYIVINFNTLVSLQHTGSIKTDTILLPASELLELLLKIKGNFQMFLQQCSLMTVSKYVRKDGRLAVIAIEMFTHISAFSGLRFYTGADLSSVD